MDPKWNEDLPIYRQLRDRVVAMILEGVLGDGDAAKDFGPFESSVQTEHSCDSGVGFARASQESAIGPSSMNALQEEYTSWSRNRSQ